MRGGYATANDLLFGATQVDVAEAYIDPYPEASEVIWRGIWQPGQTYQRGNVVAFMLAFYICLKPTTLSPNGIRDLINGEFWRGLKDYHLERLMTIFDRLKEPEIKTEQILLNRAIKL